MAVTAELSTDGSRVLLERMLAAPNESEVLRAIGRSGARPLLVTFANPFSYGQLARYPDLVREVDVVYVDGIVLAQALSCVAGRSIPRRSFDGTSLARPVFRECCRTRARVAIVGARQDEASGFRQRLEQEFPEIRVVFVRSGYFATEQEATEALEQMRAAQVEVLLCGMGAGRQEQFVVSARAHVPTLRVAFTCGGFIHQTARRSLDYYPAWMDRLQLRWAYRLWKEPETRARVLRHYPAFLFRFVNDWRRLRGRVGA